MTHADTPPSQSPAPSSATPAPPATMSAKRPPRLALLIATGFGLGYLPRAPGTAGSLGGTLLAAVVLAAFPPGYAFKLASGTESFFLSSKWLAAVPVLLVAIVGVASSRIISSCLAMKDPQSVVIDEISGMLLTFFLAPNGFYRFSDVGFVDLPSMSYPGFLVVLDSFNWNYFGVGFILFRVFDIWKPWPVRAAEKLPGGWGIMADDWVAGIYAALCLWALRVAGL